MVGGRLRAEDGWRKQHVDRAEYFFFASLLVDNLEGCSPAGYRVFTIRQS